MGLDEEQIEAVVARYERELNRYETLATTVAEFCSLVLENTKILARVQKRAKSPASLRAKLLRNEHRERYSSVDDVFLGMSDLAGVRVTTYVEADRTAVVAAIAERFAGPSGQSSPTIVLKDKTTPPEHYRATHCQVRISEHDLLPATRNLRNDSCEIQICSLLAHVFNEVEHDLAYKPVAGVPSEVERQHLDQLGMLTKAGDIAIGLLLQQVQQRRGQKG